VAGCFVSNSASTKGRKAASKMAAETGSKMTCRLGPRPASTKILKTASKMVAVKAAKMARHLVPRLASKKSLKYGSGSGIEDGLPLGVKLCINEGPEEGC
jgi:hypothetical protein